MLSSQNFVQISHLAHTNLKGSMLQSSHEVILVLWNCCSKIFELYHSSKDLLSIFMYFPVVYWWHKNIVFSISFRPTYKHLIQFLSFTLRYLCFCLMNTDQKLICHIHSNSSIFSELHNDIFQHKVEKQWWYTYHLDLSNSQQEMKQTNVYLYGLYNRICLNAFWLLNLTNLKLAETSYSHQTRASSTPVNNSI